MRYVKTMALAEANYIARLLVEKFKAGQVVLYGSLAESKYFDEASDIDLAVKGMGDDYLRAYGYCLRTSEFPLDIRVYEELPVNLKSKIDKEGICLYEKKRKIR